MFVCSRLQYSSISLDCNLGAVAIAKSQKLMTVLMRGGFLLVNPSTWNKIWGYMHHSFDLLRLNGTNGKGSALLVVWGV